MLLIMILLLIPLRNQKSKIKSMSKRRASAWPWFMGRMARHVSRIKPLNLTRTSLRAERGRPRPQKPKSTTAPGRCHGNIHFEEQLGPPFEPLRTRTSALLDGGSSLGELPERGLAVNP